MARQFEQNHQMIRNHLWNALEPGDPYDITKSLIAKMPGDARPFMGDNLQIVVFFQAAEIERLIEYLDEYRVKYKQLTRQDLDRHSYEVQIKELAEKCSFNEGLKVEVEKLREYIRRLKQEMENTRNVQQDQNLKNKYNNALQQLEFIQKQNKELNAKVSSFSLDVQHWKNRCEASQKSKLKQIDDLRNSIETQRRTQIEKDQREQEQIRKFSIERTQLETEIKRLREEISVRKTEVSDYKTRLSQSSREAQYGRTELEGRCQQLESRIRTYTEEIDGLKYSFRTINNEKNEIVGKYQGYQEQIWRMNNQIEQNRRIIQSNEQIISQLNHRLLQLQSKSSQFFELERIKQDYENKIVLMSNEIIRLNTYSESKVNEERIVLNKCSKLEYEVQTLRRQNIALTHQISQKDTTGSGMAELQHTIFQLTNDNKRLNDEIVYQRQNFASSQQLKTENVQLKRIIHDLQNEAIGIAEFRKSSQIEIERFTKREENHIRRINELEEEFRRLQSRKGDQRQVLDVNEFKQKILVSDETLKIKRNYQQQIVLLNRQNGNMKMELDNLRRHLNMAGGSVGSNVEFLNQQIRQLSARQRDWLVEKQELLRIIEDNQRRSRVPVQYQQRFNQYEIRIKSLTQELQVFRRDRNKLGDMDAFETRLREQNQEIKRLKEKLRLKNQQIITYQAGSEQLTYLRGQIQQLLIAKQSLESNLIKVTSEINVNNNQLVDEHERLKLRHQEVLSKMNLNQQRINTSVREHEILINQNANLNNTIQILLKEVNEYKRLSTHQINDFNQTRIITKQSSQSFIHTINQMNERIRHLAQENDLLRRKINEFPRLMDIEVKNHSSIFQQRLVNVEQKYLVEQQRLSSTLQQTEQLRRRLFELSTANERSVIYEKKVVEYEQRINNLIHENEQLRRLDQSQTQRVLNELNQYRMIHPQLQNQNNSLRKQILQFTQKLEIEINNRVHIENQMRIVIEENNRFKQMGGPQKIMEYQSQIGFLKQEIERVRKSEKELALHFNESNMKTLELTHEIERLSVFVRQSKTTESNLQNLTQEIERLNNVLRLKVNESVEWHNRYLALEGQTMIIRQEHQASQNQSATYKRRIQQYEQKFLNLNGQFEKLSVIINQLKNQNRILKQENFNLQNNKESEDKNKVLSQEIERLTALKLQLEQQILELRMRFVDQNALEKRIKQHLTLLVVLFAEIESLRKRIKDKEKEVEQVRRSSLAPFMS